MTMRVEKSTVDQVSHIVHVLCLPCGVYHCHHSGVGGNGDRVLEALAAESKAAHECCDNALAKNEWVLDEK